MKQILLSILMLVCVMGIKAQDAMVATLQSGEQSLVFYGANGLVDAVNVASTGDLITLSAGTFNTTTINKSLRIQGAGYLDDPGKGGYRTVLNADLRIELADGNTDDFLLEGVFSSHELQVQSSVSINRFVLKRCRFRDVNFRNSSTANSQLEHCRISANFTVGSNAKTFSVINSIIGNMAGNTGKSMITYRNSIICNFNEYYDDIIANFENCILNASGGNYRHTRLHENCVVKNCLSFVSGMFDDVQTKEKVWTPENLDQAEFWNSGKGYSDTDLYELTEQAKSQYIGTDGTEIGINGGIKPFTFTPSHPQITKRDIATKTSGGKLKVNITVEAQDN